LVTDEGGGSPEGGVHGAWLSWRGMRVAFGGGGQQLVARKRGSDTGDHWGGIE
jgi:hypothetical protein